jgi:hypothetical protein
MMVARSRSLLVASLVGALLTAGAASADIARSGGSKAPAPAPSVGPAPNWIDHLDTYATDSQLHGQGGWEGWANSEASGAFTSDDQARTLANSIDIAAASDLVHPYTGYTTGTWVYTAWQFIPSGGTGLSYFLLLNTYSNDAACTGCNWSTQVNFDLASGTMINDGASGGSGTALLDVWAPIEVVINLDANTQTFFYNGTMLYTGTWTEEVSGGGVANIATVDLFANGATSVFYDDLSLSNLPFLDGFESESVQNWHFYVP